jgi:hypothetical protein
MTIYAEIAFGNLLVQTPAIDLQAARQRLESYSHLERLAAATVDSASCANLGYEVPSGGGPMPDVIELWERSFRSDGVEISRFIDRYNAQVGRLQEEFEAEASHAETSREAFRFFKINLTKRCDALAFDRPDWVRRTDHTLVTSVMAWNDIELRIFGPAEE